MLKVVGFVVCLAFHLCSGQDCSDFTADNCGLYYCATNSNGDCVTDPCYDNNLKDGNAVSCTPPPTPAGLKCRLFTVDYYNRSGLPSPTGGPADSYCILADTHFSDCKLANPQDFLPNPTGDIGDTQVIAMETYCKNIMCGGLEFIFDTSGNTYFYCGEPGTDGAFTADDFDVDNCKHQNFFVKDNKCVYDSCLEVGTDPDDCTGSCSLSTIDGEDFCFNADRNVTKCALSFNETAAVDCAGEGCGELRVAKSKSGKQYFYCDEPTKPPTCPKGGAASLHVPVLASLLIIAFTFIFSV